MPTKSIEEVIDRLEEIILQSKKEESTLGYFAALYQKVTITVKEKLGTNYFDDDERMEKLDVIFANRYLQAYYDIQNNKTISKSWESTFNLSKDDGLIVLQHLLLGMNAHINLDLGIAAAEISSKSSIDSLEGDFNKINDILNNLVEDVQSNLSSIWPTLIKILKFFNKVDDFLISFSMTLARDGAWKYAKELVEVQPNEKSNFIKERDVKIANIVPLIVNHGFVSKLVFKIIRFTERGSISDKIDVLRITQS